MAFKNKKVKLNFENFKIETSQITKENYKYFEGYKLLLKYLEEACECFNVCKNFDDIDYNYRINKFFRSFVNCILDSLLNFDEFKKYAIFTNMDLETIKLEAPFTYKRLEYDNFILKTEIDTIAKNDNYHEDTMLCLLKKYYKQENKDNMYLLAKSFLENAKEQEKETLEILEKNFTLYLNKTALEEK